MFGLSRSLLLRLITGAAAIAVVAVLVGTDLVREAGQESQRSFTVGLITNNPNGLRNINGFQSGMEALGYVEGGNMAFLFSGAPTPEDELEVTIKQMVAEGADLIFTAGTPTGVAAHSATRESSVPVVFGVIADPIAAGVITSLSRPGGNMTGVMLSQNQGRRLELLCRILPDNRRVLLPYNPEDAAPVSAAAQLEDAASMIGVTLVHAHARNSDEVSAMLADIPDAIDAVFMLPDSTVNRHVKDLIEATNARNLPVSGPSAAQVEAGAIMSYGIDHYEVGMQAARIADRILRGGDPAILPVETADFYLTLNVAAASRIGLELSEEVLQQADVILREDSLSR